MKFKECYNCEWREENPALSPCHRCFEADMYTKHVNKGGYVSKGTKFDQNKLDWTLLPWKEVEQVLEILEFGAKKYSRDNWKEVESSRYEKAAMRHLVSYVTGEKLDQESGKSHLAHLVCNALFLMWKDKKL